MAEIGKSEGKVYDAQAAAMAANVGTRGPAADSHADDAASEAARRIAVKNLEVKLQQLKKAQAPAAQESYAPSDRAQKRFQEALEGKLGPEVAQGARAWAGSGELQAKLTQAQKRLFQEAMVQEPRRAAEAGVAMAKIVAQPGFATATVGSQAQSLALLHGEVLQQPQVAEPIIDLLQGRFLQSKGGDAATKSDFLRFGLAKLKAGEAGPVRDADDMLDTLSRHKTPGFAQAASMRMVQRYPQNRLGMQNVDAFVRNPAVQEMPDFARGKAVEGLAKADGSTAVREGFEALAQEPNLRAQTFDNQGRLFAGVVSGRGSELRALTDKTLVALRSESFPTRDAQVTRLLGKLAGQISKRGAAGVDMDGLLRDAKASEMPGPPRLIPTEGLSEEEAARARAQNRAKVIKFYTQISRRHDALQGKLDGARYLEDVNHLPLSLRLPEAPDTEGLTPEDKAFVSDRAQLARERHTELRRTLQGCMRNLGTSRMPLRKRVARDARRRALGEQPAYFNPRTGRSIAGRARTTLGVGTTWTATSGRQAAGGGRPSPLAATPHGAARQLPATPQTAARRFAAGQAEPRPTPGARGAAAQGGLQGGRGAGARSGVARQRPVGTDASLDIEEILAQLPDGLSQPQRMKEAKRLLAQRWQAQMMKVMDRLVDDDGGPSPAPEPEATEPAAARGEARATSPQRRPAAPRSGPSAAPDRGARKVALPTDGFGIPRVPDRDLGGMQPSRIVKPPAISAEADAAEVPLDAPYTGRPIVRPGTSVRELQVLLEQVPWVQLTRGEKAALRNLGWQDQGMWNTRHEPTARWPVTMRQPFGKLNLTQRQSLRQLGMDAASWDDFVADFVDPDA